MYWTYKMLYWTHMKSLHSVANEVRCSERTLRRSISRGMLRGRRVGARGVELTFAEELYVRKYWPLLSQIQKVLRTEPAVRLAVLIGSVSTGEDTAGSDIDLVVSLDGDCDVLTSLRLARKLRQRIGQPFEVVTLEQARSHSPFLADVLTEGRVLIDRDQIWAELKKDERKVLSDAQAQEDRIAQAAATVLANAQARQDKVAQATASALANAQAAN